MWHEASAGPSEQRRGGLMSPTVLRVGPFRFYFFSLHRKGSAADLDDYR